MQAEARYGYCKFQTVDGGIKQGDPCLIINVTIRNDYNETRLPPIRKLNQSPYNFSRYGYYIYLNALLFDSSGSVGFKAMAVADQNSGLVVSYNNAAIRVDSNQTKNFGIYIASSNRDINRFELRVYDVGGQEMPTSSP